MQKTTMITIHRYAAACLGVVLLHGCLQKSPFAGGNDEMKPSTSQPHYLPKEVDTEDKTKVLLHGIYDVTIRKRGNRDVACEGTAEIISYSGYSVIKGIVPCELLAKKEIVVGDGKIEETEIVPVSELIAKGLDPRVERIKRKGSVEYIPFKPNFIGPVIQDPEKYRNIDFVEPLTVKLQTGDPKKPTEEGSGTIHVKVLEINGTYKPKNYPETFTKIMHYHINATGFDGLPDKSAAGIYQVYEYRWNTMPLALANIHIEGAVADFEKSWLKGFLGNLIAFKGGLIIDMDLKQIVPLAEDGFDQMLKTK